MAAKSFENPLMSHARMRAMFRALVEVRLLEQKAGRRGRSSSGVPRLLEACWVGTAIDLKHGDLASVAGMAGRTEYVRGVGLRQNARGATVAELRTMLKQEETTFRGSAADRLLCAVGSAMAVKAAGDHGIVMAYAGVEELTQVEWQRVLLAAGGELPLVVVATPSPLRRGKQAEVGGPEASPGAGLRKAGMRVPAIPMIPVDAGDVVAIYRVAQETTLRARVDSRTALIECVATGVDPVQRLQGQLVQKGICTEVWAKGVEAQFRATIARL